MLNLSWLCNTDSSHRKIRIKWVSKLTNRT